VSVLAHAAVPSRVDASVHRTSAIPQRGSLGMRPSDAAAAAREQKCEGEGTNHGAAEP